MSALQSFANIFSVPDLRKRVLFTFLMLAIYRLGAHIPTPGIDPASMNEFFKATAGSTPGVGMCDPSRYTASSRNVKMTRLRRSGTLKMFAKL